MDIQVGDWVLVNVAPFIGSSRRHEENIPCEVVGLCDEQVEVQTQSPYREIRLFVARNWVERKLEPSKCLSS
jgi:hypothetical protein